jgi:outer membrane immunogenic protein
MMSRGSDIRLFHVQHTGVEMRKFLLATSALAALVMAAPAGAADIPVKAPVYRPPPPACAQFGGFYIGGHVGWGYTQNRWHDLDHLAESVHDSLPRAETLSESGFMGGVQAGYNWQSGCTVFGVVADYAWASINTDEKFLGNRFAPDEESVVVNNRFRGMGTLRARSGVVVDNLLIYVTGGIAFAKFERSWTLTDPSDLQTEGFASNRWRWGWVAGFGTEWALWGSNWSLVSEVLYARFQKDNSTFTSTVFEPGQAFRFRFEDDVWTTKIGLNYRFGVGKYPVSARY